MTLPELLVVVSIIGLAVAVAVPTISRSVRAARLRTSTDQLAISLKAARMIAVTRRAPVDFVVNSHPQNSYEYVDAQGTLRHFDLPVGVRLTTTTTPVVFQPTGEIGAAVTMTLQADLTPRETETWDVTTNVVGISRVNRQ